MTNTHETPLLSTESAEAFARIATSPCVGRVALIKARGATDVTMILTSSGLPLPHPETFRGPLDQVIAEAAEFVAVLERES